MTDQLLIVLVFPQSKQRKQYSMLSKFYSISPSNLDRATSIINRVIKTYHMQTFLQGLYFIKQSQDNLFQYVSRQNCSSIQKLLGVDIYKCDQKITSIPSDKEQPSQRIYVQKTLQNIQNRKKSSQLSNSKLKKKSHKLIKQSGHKKQYQNNLKNSQFIVPYVNNPVPLLSDECNRSQSLNSDEQQFYEHARQRKTYRSLRKTQLMKTNHQLQVKIIRRFNFQHKSEHKTVKKDKFNYCQHYVDMEVTVDDEKKGRDSDKSQKSKRKMLLTQMPTHTQSLPISPRKDNSYSNADQKRKWEPLVTQDRMLRLNSFQAMKLSPGVSYNVQENKGGNIPFTTRRKLQFLKNNQLDSRKIKFNELLSFKRLGTTNNLAYCSSVKTIKSIKENTQTNISIDSRQMMSQYSSGSRKLIKIANKKMYDELIYDENANNLQAFRKSKFKKTKEGKVRFDSISLH